MANKIDAGMANTLGRASNMSNNIMGRATNLMDKGKAQVGKVYKGTVKFDTDWIQKPLIILLIGAVFLGILILLKKLLFSYQSTRRVSNVIMAGTKEGKHSTNVSNDIILKSENKDGIEFTYSFWILIMDLSTYKVGEWKHIFHKGSPSSFPNRAPGVWLHPTKNSLRIYMNTFDDPLTYTDIDDIPVKKWVNVQIMIQNINSHTEDSDELVEQKRNQVMDVYINGMNKKSLLFDSVPRQNNGDIYFNLFGGFDGYISKMKYFPYALDFKESGVLVKEGPSKIQTLDTGEIPPYLNDTWWFDFNKDGPLKVETSGQVASS